MLTDMIGFIIVANVCLRLLARRKFDRGIDFKRLLRLGFKIGSELKYDSQCRFKSRLDN